MGIDFWLMLIGVAIFVSVLAHILTRWNLNLAIEYGEAYEDHLRIKEEIATTPTKEGEG